MCVTTFDASGLHRSAFGTARCGKYTVSRAPNDGVDDSCPPNFFTTCTVISGTTRVLENLKTHPSDLRTAEGRRRALL